MEDADLSRSAMPIQYGRGLHSVRTVNADVTPIAGERGGGVGGRAKYCNGEKIIYKNLFII